MKLQNKRSGLRLPTVTALIALMAPILGAQAQSSTDTLEEVVVESTYTTDDQLDTATGLGLSISETPQSVSVMTFERIADQNLRSLSDVVYNAPGISAKERDSARHSFSARGFDIDNYQVDGVPMEWSSGGDAGETESDTALYERVEVVRGATGLLTGAGNPSASINLVRKHADMDALRGFATLGFGRWDQRNAMVDVGAPLGFDGRLRGRIVLNHEDGDSFTDLLGNTKSVGYAVIEGDVTQRTLLRAGASYQDNDPQASTWGGLPSWYDDGSRTNWPRSKTIGARWTQWASTNRNYFATALHQINDRWDLRIDYNNARNDAELNLLYLFGSPNRETGLGLGASPYRSDTSREQYSIGARLSGTFDLFGREHEVIVGYSFVEQTYVSDSREVLEAAGIGNFNIWDGDYPEPTYGAAVVDIDAQTKQRGLYAATRLSVTDALKFVTGGRLATWKETGLSYGEPIAYGDSDVFIPYAGALYDINETHRVYGSYTEIFKPQDALDINRRQLDPVVGAAYELGLKSAFFAGGLHTTIAVFRIEQDNLAQSTGELIPGTIFEAARAIQGTTSEGFEIEIVGRPLPGWETSFSFTSFTAKDAEDLDVNTQQPRRLLKLFTTYQFLDRLPALTIGGGVNWEHDSYALTVNPVTADPQRLTQDAYLLVNLMARYEFSESLSAQLNIDNLLDEKYYGQIGFYDQLSFGEPRNYNVGFSYRF
jgi:outer membrane receptor for ferric coprogen and ferric-rhodotorulic acid